MAHSEESAFIIARTRWRGAVGATDNAGFEDFWGKVKTKVAGAIKAENEEAVREILDSVPGAGLQRKRSLEGAAKLDAEISAAHDRFIRAGGSEAEWDREKDTIRKELLKTAALRGSTADHNVAQWYARNS